MQTKDFNIAQHIKVFTNGDIIFQEGSKGREMYVILKGEVEITKLISGQPHVLSIIRSGEFFGEMSTIRGVPRVATARAIGQVECLGVNPDSFKAVLQRKPGFGIKVIKELCDRIEAANKQIEKMALLRELEKITVQLVNIATNYGQKPFTNMKINYDNALNEVASKIKSDREMVGKIFASMVKYNRIDVIVDAGIRYIQLSDKLLKN